MNWEYFGSYDEGDLSIWHSSVDSKPWAMGRTCRIFTVFSEFQLPHPCKRFATHSQLYLRWKAFKSNLPFCTQIRKKFRELASLSVVHEFCSLVRCLVNPCDILIILRSCTQGLHSFFELCWICLRPLPSSQSLCLRMADSHGLKGDDSTSREGRWPEDLPAAEQGWACSRCRLDKSNSMTFMYFDLHTHAPYYCNIYYIFQLGNLFLPYAKCKCD